MTLYDISRSLEADMAVWPGDTPYQLEKILSRQAGSSVNLTTLTLSAHTGTHIDAPIHFTDKGASIDQLNLEPYWGSVQVVSVSKAQGPLLPEDFAAYDLSLAPRLLVHSAASLVENHTFPRDIVYPSPQLIAWLAEQGLILYGTDAPSMDAVDSTTMPGHHALQKHGLAILEGLDLSQVPDGLYDLVALPLKIMGGDGSPVRAVLKSLDLP